MFTNATVGGDLTVNGNYINFGMDKCFNTSATCIKN